MRNNKFVILFLVSFLFLILLEPLVCAGNQTGIIKRTPYADISLLEGNQYQAILYPKAVNMLNSEGVYEPYEDVTNFSFDGDRLTIRWNDKAVILNLYTKDDKEKQEKLNEKTSLEKNQLNLRTNIKKEKGKYYFDHQLEKNQQPKKLGYLIETQNVECKTEGYVLICGEQRIDFNEAVKKQGINVSIDKEKVEFEGEDLSYIDPEISLDDTLSDQFVRFKCEDTSFTDTGGYIGFIDTGDGYEYREIKFYNTNSLPDDAVISSIEFSGNLGSFIQDNGCPNSVQVRIKNMDYDDVNDWYDDGDLLNIWNSMTMWGEYGSMIGINPSDAYSPFNINLGISAISKMQGLLASNEPFVIGLTGNPQYNGCSDVDCSINGIDDMALKVTYTAYPLNPEVTIGSYVSWNYSGRFDDSLELDFTNELNQALDDCVPDEFGYCSIPVTISSDSASIINISGPEIFYNISNFVWNTTGFWSDNDYQLRILATDGLENSSWYNTGNFTITSSGPPEVTLNTPSNSSLLRTQGIIFNCSAISNLSISNITLYGNFNGTWGAYETKNLTGSSNSTTFIQSISDGEYLWSCISQDNYSQVGMAEENYTLNINTSLPIFSFQNTTGQDVAQFRGNGDLSLKGNCTLSSNCMPPENSFIFQNSTGDTTAYIDPEGNLCIESGTCSNYNQQSCNPANYAFIIQDYLANNLSYIDFNGNLCLTGQLNEYTLE